MSRASALEDLDVEASRAVAPLHERRLRLNLVNDLKLLFAALGAGGSVVPLGDNSRTARLLADYAASLRGALSGNRPDSYGYNQMDLRRNRPVTGSSTDGITP